MRQIFTRTCQIHRYLRYRDVEYNGSGRRDGARGGFYRAEQILQDARVT